jgi:lysyl-tRNA synthetase class 2
VSKNEAGPPAQDENQIVAERRAKLAALRAQGIAFPNDYRREHLAGDLQHAYGAMSKEELEGHAIRVAVAGRMMLKRVMGKASFATLQDMSGRIQVYVSNDATGVDAHEAFKHWDLGDILGVEGTLFKTRTGELTVNASKVRLLAKALRPLPEKFHGLADQEQKYRARYLDLITSEEARRTFAIRSRVIQEMRAFMVAQGCSRSRGVRRRSRSSPTTTRST